MKRKMREQDSCEKPAKVSKAWRGEGEGLEGMNEGGDGDYEDDRSKRNCRSLVCTTEDSRKKRFHTRQGEGFRLQRLWSKLKNLVR